MHIYISLWTRKSDKCWDHGVVMAEICTRCPESWATITLTRISSFLLREPSLVRDPQQGQESGDEAGRNKGITLSVKGFFSPLLLAAVLQLSLRGAQHSCLIASFPRCSLNEKESWKRKGKKLQKTNMGTISNICYLSLKASVLVSGQLPRLGVPSFGKTHTS